MKLKKAAPTPEQQTAKKQEVVEWAKASLADPNTLIVDVETTGLLTKDPKTEIVQISMIDHEGRIVFSSMVNPQRPIPMAAQRVHGIDDRCVQSAPPWPVIGRIVAGLMESKRVVCYNAGFDVHLIVTLFQRYDIDIPEFECECAMEAYSAFIGEWSKAKEDYKWQKLPKLAYGKAHQSVVDCESTRLLLKKMAGDFTDEPDSDTIALDF